MLGCGCGRQVTPTLACRTKGFLLHAMSMEKIQVGVDTGWGLGSRALSGSYWQWNTSLYIQGDTVTQTVT